MLALSQLQYTIIVSLILIIVAYCIFAYPFVFNQVDIIQYQIKRTTVTPLVAFDDRDKKQMEELATYIRELFSTIITTIAKTVVYVKTNVENLHQFIKNLKEDFAI
jgi:hypothetical protein